ncbi:MAG: hypothetical protein ACRDH5_04400, partial [bacterium]
MVEVAAQLLSEQTRLLGFAVAPRLERVTLQHVSLVRLSAARVLAVLGEAVTTDHVSPAGSIPQASPAGQYLVGLGVKPVDFNQYGTRRGNHEVLIRGTFANVRLRNALVQREGWWTRHLPSGQEMTIYDASMRYAREG